MTTSNSVVKTLLIIRPLKSIPDGTMNDASTQSAKLHNSQSIARGDYFFTGNCISFGRATRKKQLQVLVVTRQIEKLQKKYPLNACLKSGRTADLTFGTLRSFKRINVGVVTLEFGVLSKRDAICKRWNVQSPNPWYATTNKRLPKLQQCQWSYVAPEAAKQLQAVEPRVSGYEARKILVFSLAAPTNMTV